MTVFSQILNRLLHAGYFSIVDVNFSGFMNAEIFILRPEFAFCNSFEEVHKILTEKKTLFDSPSITCVVSVFAVWNIYIN